MLAGDVIDNTSAQGIDAVLQDVLGRRVAGGVDLGHAMEHLNWIGIAGRPFDVDHGVGGSHPAPSTSLSGLIGPPSLQPVVGTLAATLSF